MASADPQSPLQLSAQGGRLILQTSNAVVALNMLLRCIAGMSAWDLARTGTTGAEITLPTLTAGQGVQTAPGEPTPVQGSQDLCLRAFVAAAHDQETKCMVRCADRTVGAASVVGSSSVPWHPCPTLEPVGPLVQQQLLRVPTWPGALVE